MLSLDFAPARWDKPIDRLSRQFYALPYRWV